MGAAVAEHLSTSSDLLLVDRHAASVTEIAERLGARSLALDLTAADAPERLLAEAPSIGAFVLTAGLSPSMASAAIISARNVSSARSSSRLRSRATERAAGTSPAGGNGCTLVRPRLSK